MAGESTINDTARLGGLAKAGTSGLPSYQGGIPERMMEANLEMYGIATAEHSYNTIRVPGFRGVTVGIAVVTVIITNTTPLMDVGVIGKGGRQIGAGVTRKPLACFQAAVEALAEEGS